MKLITQNAAIQLFDKARLLAQMKRDSWKCIYLNLSEKRKIYSPDLVEHFYVKPLPRLLADMEGAVYQCDDGDVFILFQGLLAPVVERLRQHIDDFAVTEPEEDGDDGAYTVFDLGSCWPEFYDVCEVKFKQQAYAQRKAVLSPSTFELVSHTTH